MMNLNWKMALILLKMSKSISLKNTKNFFLFLFIKKINCRLVFKTKDGYKLESKIPEIVKLLGSTQKLVDITGNR